MDYQGRRVQGWTMSVPTGRSAIHGLPGSATEALCALSRVVLDDVDNLTTRLTNMLVEREPAYAHLNDGSGHDLGRHLRGNIELWVQSLAGDQRESADLESAARETGRLRALQGLPLEAVLRAYRLAGRALWEALLTASREHFDGTYDNVLLDVASDVWRLIDNSSSVLADAYRREEARLCGEKLSHKQALLNAILERDDPALVKEASTVLGLPESGPLLCIVAPLESPRDEPLRSPRSALAAQGVTSFWSTRARDVVGVVSLGSSTAEVVLDALRPAVLGPAGASPVVAGLANAADGYEMALIAARTLRRPGLATLDDRLPEALLISNPVLAARLLPVAVGSALSLPGHERKTLLDTLEALLICNGSATHAAERLHCHRNTVLYRLQRIEAITGRKLAKPRDRLVLTLGILARQTHPTQPTGGLGTRFLSSDSQAS